MKLNLLIRIVFAAVAAIVLLTGCATDKPQQSRRYVWPRPPDPPKIEWIKSYYGEDDFPKGGFSSFVEVLFGKTPARSFKKPIDIKSNGKGIVYVTDVAIPGIFVYDLVNLKIDLWEKGSDPDAGLAIIPFFIALDDVDNIYVVGTGIKDIFVLDPSGKLKRRIGYNGKVKNPGGIAVDSKGGRIYLVDSGENKVAVFDFEGKHLFSFGNLGEGDGEFNRPSPITINHKKEVIVGDTGNGRIQIFDRDGKFLRKFGERGDSPTDIQILKGVAVDSDDNIYVTDGRASQLKIFNTNGDNLLTIGTAYSVTQTYKEAPGGFLLPQGIHIDKNDSIFIADQANMRFQQFKYLKDSGEVDKGAAPNPISIKK